MTQHIKSRQPGGTHFFTTRLADRSSSLLTDEIDHLRNATRKTMARYPFRIDAIAILPNTIHTIWTLPLDDSNFSLRWSLLKSLFSKEMPTPAYRTASQQQRNDKGIWQKRYWEHVIREEADRAAHVEMIHNSPVQAGLCASPYNWAHSSVHRLGATRGSDQFDTGVDQGVAPKTPTPTYAPTFREEGFAHHP